MQEPSSAPAEITPSASLTMLPCSRMPPATQARRPAFSSCARPRASMREPASLAIRPLLRSTAPAESTTVPPSRRSVPLGATTEGLPRRSVLPATSSTAPAAPPTVRLPAAALDWMMVTGALVGVVMQTDCVALGTWPVDQLRATSHEPPAGAAQETWQAAAASRKVAPPDAPAAPTGVRTRLARNRAARVVARRARLTGRWAVDGGRWRAPRAVWWSCRSPSVLELDRQLSVTAGRQLTRRASYERHSHSWRVRLASRLLLG